MHGVLFLFFNWNFSIRFNETIYKSEKKNNKEMQKKIELKNVHFLYFLNNRFR